MTNQKRLTEDQFWEAIQKLHLSRQTTQIAHGVLVEGRPQFEYVKMFGITKSAVSQTVQRVWNAADSLPEGFERVSAVLPEHQAFIVRRWAQSAQERLKNEIRHEDSGSGETESDQEKNNTDISNHAFNHP